MRLLLDTSVLIWSIDRPALLPELARGAIVDPENSVYASVVSVWEMAIKVGLGKLPIRPDVGAWLPEELAIADFQLLSIGFDHVVAVERLALHHRDPFDRLLITQAMTENLTIVTADRMFERYQIALLPCW